MQSSNSVLFSFRWLLKIWKKAWKMSVYVYGLSHMQAQATPFINATWRRHDLRTTNKTDLMALESGPRGDYLQLKYGSSEAMMYCQVQWGQMLDKRQCSSELLTGGDLPPIWCEKSSVVSLKAFLVSAASGFPFGAIWKYYNSITGFVFSCGCQTSNFIDQ